MRSLKKLLSWAENNKKTATMMNALPVATAWEHFADQIRYEIDNMSQDEDEDKVLKRLLRCNSSINSMDYWRLQRLNTDALSLNNRCPESDESFLNIG